MKIVTCAILRNSSDQILLCRRAPGQKNAGKWEFPGGKLEEGESLAVCLERELHEELSIEAVAGRVVLESAYTHEHGSILLIALECSCENFSPELSVHDQFQWVQPDQLVNYDLTPADIPIARHLKNA